jgi:hypothetical protein
MLRRIFGANRDEECVEKHHNDQLHYLHSSPTIMLVITSRRIRWVGHVACMGRGEECTGF